jgi:hypothetical protein
VPVLVVILVDDVADFERDLDRHFVVEIDRRFDVELEADVDVGHRFGRESRSVSVEVMFGTRSPIRILAFSRLRARIRGLASRLTSESSWLARMTAGPR